LQAYHGASSGAFAFAAKTFKDQVIEFEKGYFYWRRTESWFTILAFRNYMLNRNKTIFKEDYSKKSNHRPCVELSDVPRAAEALEEAGPNKAGR